MLFRSGPLVCNFSGNEFYDFHKLAILSNDDPIFDWTSDKSLTDIDQECAFSHTVLLVSYECFPDNNNPTHYLFKFKDSYKYGNNNNFRDGYFFIKVPILDVNGPISSKVPWKVGDSYGLNNLRIYGVKVQLALKTKEEIKKDLIDSKCCSKWYCIQTVDLDDNPTCICTEKSVFDPEVSILTNSGSIIASYDNESACLEGCADECSTPEPTEEPTETEQP